MKSPRALPSLALALVLAASAASCHDFSKVKFGKEATDGPGDDSPPPVLPPSCAGASPPLCGSNLESCCARGDVVPAVSAFSRGYDKSAQDTQDGLQIVGWKALTVAPAAVDSFALDKYEVTVGRFRGFFSAYDALLGTIPMDDAGRHPSVPMSGWSKEWTNANSKSPGTMYASTQANFRVALDGCNGSASADKFTSWIEDPSRANDDRPMTCVTWYEAFLFCIWDQGRLPTETEWNVAAAGGEQFRAYPWNSPDQAGALTVLAADGNIGPSLTFPPMRVGSFPDGAGRWGHMDLAGNAYEFVRDRTSELKPVTYTVATSNPIELVGDLVVIRGGSYVFDRLRARTAYRAAVHDRDDPPARRFPDVGWRCARSPY